MYSRPVFSKLAKVVVATMPLLLGVAVCLATASCDRKEEDPAPTKAPPPRPPSPPPENRRGTKILETSNSSAGALIAQRLMEREQTPSLPPGAEDPDALMAEYADATAERKVEILSLLGADSSPGAWDFLCQAANNQDQTLRLAALDALALHQGGDPSRVIDSCLSYPDEETRALAATLLGVRVRSADVWAKAALDPSPAVRVAYLSAVEEAPLSIKLATSEKAIKSGDPQLRLEAASVLGGAKSEKAVELLIPLLDDPSATGAAHDALLFLSGMSFGSAAEAQDWRGRPKSQSKH